MKGVIAAIPTPVNGAGNFDSVMFLEHANWALEHGCDGLNVLGSTGEASTLSVSQRKSVMDFASANLPLDRLMVGTGTPALDETIELTMLAAKLGFPVALVLPPYYYKPVSNEGLRDWYLAVHDALGDRSLELFFYNYPQMTGINLSVDLIADLNRRAPQRFTGIKDSSGNLDYCASLVAAASKLRVFPSSETTLAGAHKTGFSGCISATANITAPICARVWSTTDATVPEDIQSLQTQREQITQCPLIPAIKYLVGQRSNNKKWEQAMPPFQPLNETQRASLDAAFS